MPGRVEIELPRPPSRTREPLRQLRIQGRRITQKALAWGMFWTLGGAILAFLVGLVPLTGVEVEFQHNVPAAITRTCVGAMLGLLAIAILRGLARPWLKNWKEQPVRIWVLDRGWIDPTPGSERFMIPVRLENRSNAETYQCGLSVVGVSGDVTFAVPRLVRSVDLSPNSELPVDLVYWDRRAPPFSDSDRLYIVSPLAAFAEAMLAPLPLDPHEIELEARVQGKELHRVSCRVWVDEARTLRLEEVVPAG